MGDWRDIPAAIHNLTRGTQVIPSDVFKAFNLLLNEKDREAAKNITDILDSFKPASSIEKLLRTKLVDRYKVSSEMWTLLMSNDSLYVNQALKFDWFFSRNDNTGDFLQNVLPKLSYSLRLKILNRYASHLKDAFTGEAIYIGVKSRYGINTAALTLPACSESFVQDEITKFTTTLPRIVVLALTEKYPKLSAQYVEKLVDEKTSHKHKISHYDCIFVKLSQLDFGTFVNMLEKHGCRFPSFHLGRRQLKKLLKTHFDKVHRDFDTMSIPFTRHKILRRLSLDQFKSIYSSCLLPSESTELSEENYWEPPFVSLKHLNPSVRPLVFTAAFKMKYNRDCTSDDVLLKFPYKWLSNLPVETRIKWVDAKIDDVDDVVKQAKYISYLPIEHSIPRLKSLLASSSDARHEVVAFMMRSVKYNGGPQDLREVVAYFNKVHRHENSLFKFKILNAIVDLNDRFLFKMDLDDWVPIEEFIIKIQLHSGNSYDSLWQLSCIHRKIVHTCFLKNVDPDPYLRKYVELSAQSNNGELGSNTVHIICHGSEYTKNIIEWFIKEIPKIKLKSYDDYFVVDLVNRICKYNRAHKLSRIAIPDWLVEGIKKIIVDPDKQHLQVSLVKILETNNDDQLNDLMLDLYFPKYAVPCRVLCRLLKKTPEQVLNNVEIFVPNTIKKRFRDYSPFYRKCRLYGGISSKVIDVALQTLEQQLPEMGVLEFKNQLKTKSHAVQTLGILQDPTTYLKLCSEHAPTKPKIEDNSKETQIEYGTQKAICKSLTYVSTPLESLSLLPKFTGGDYLKIVCGSLFGVCVRIPEDVILPVLEEWVDCPVSLRKHILRLVYNVAPIDKSVATFQNMFRTEKNTSLRLVLFLLVHKTFIAEPNDDSYKTFTSIVLQLTEDDKEILDKIFDVDNIHEAYVSQYIELLWQLTDTKWKNVKTKGKQTMIKSIDKHVFKFLSDGVCDMILQYELTSTLPNAPSNFVCFYLLYCPEEKRRYRLDSVMAALNVPIKTLWNDLNRSGSGYAFPIRRAVSDIIQSLCSMAMDSEEPAQASALLSDVKNSFLDSIRLADFLKESILIDVFALYLSLKSSGDERNYAARFADLYSDYIEQHEIQFGYSLICHLCTTDKLSISNTKLALELLTNHTHPSCHVLATELLCSETTDEAEIPMIEPIIDALSSSKIPQVRASAVHYFRNLHTSVAMTAHHTDASQAV